MPELKLTIQHSVYERVEVYRPRLHQWVPGVIQTIHAKWYENVDNIPYNPLIEYTVHLDAPDVIRRLRVPPYVVIVSSHWVAVLGSHPHSHPTQQPIQQPIQQPTQEQE